MIHEIRLSPGRYDESSQCVRVPLDVWAKILKAVSVQGGVVLEHYDASQARDFANALRAALRPPKPRPPVRRRYAVFQQAYEDPGAHLLQEGMRGVIEDVLAIFDRGSVLVQKTIASALRALPAR